MALRKKRVPFLTCFRKRGVPRKGRRGVPSEKGASNPGGKYTFSEINWKLIISPLKRPKKFKFYGV